MKEIFLVWLFFIIRPKECLPAREPIENPKLFQGDIHLTSLQKAIISKHGLYGYAVLTSAKWDQVIPYSLSFAFDSDPFATNAIRNALNEIEAKTCLRFVKRTTQMDYLHFAQGQGCHAHVGRQIGWNVVSLGLRCLRKGYIHHEIGHTLGFFHEQSRPDRNRYVKIRWENIRPSVRRNFEVLPLQLSNSLGFRYDFDSVMHYGSKAFNDNDRITIQTLDLRNMHRIGQRRGFSSTDYAQLNKLYNCPVPSPSAAAVVTTIPPTHPPATFSKPNTVYICESTSRLISCGQGSIYIVLSYFGRETWSICPAFKTITKIYCHALDALVVVRNSCEGKNYCWMSADPGFFSPDPCRGTPKYLQIDYICKS